MNKFRKWLINKLGGSYDNPKLLNLHVTHTITPVRTLVIETVVDSVWYDDNMEYIKEVELAPRLGEKMIKEGLVNITMSEPDFTGQRIMRMECKIVDMRGDKDG